MNMTEPVHHALVVTVECASRDAYILLVVTDARTYITQDQKFVCVLEEAANHFNEEDTANILRIHGACVEAFAQTMAARPRHLHLVH
jgi:hypothetical protein